MTASRGQPGAVAGRPQRPPGPRGDRWSGSLLAFESDRLAFLSAARDEYGGLVTFDARTTIVNDLGLARTALDSRAGFEIVGSFLNRPVPAAERVERDDLRRHLNAGLRRSVVGHLATTTAATTRAAVEHTRREQGPVFDPLPMLERTFSSLIAEFYVGPESADQVRDAVTGLLDALGAIFGNPFALPAHWPTRANLRVRRRYRSVRRVLDPLVSARALDHQQGDDFAGAVTRSATAEGHPSERICDLLIGSLLAAQRVPAAAASWTLMELARSPGWSVEVRADRSLLPAVVSEAMRLHPPTWLLRRVATREVELAGYAFPTGHNFLVSPYVIHRDARLFDDPTAFRPDRWRGPGPVPEVLTFGRGRHLCPGRDLGAVLLDAAVGAVLETWSVTDESADVHADPRSTLVPRGLRLRFSDQASSDAGR